MRSSRYGLWCIELTQADGEFRRLNDTGASEVALRPALPESNAREGVLHRGSVKPRNLSTQRQVRLDFTSRLV